MDRVCVYTCITGDYDELKPIQKEDGIDYLCFTNNLDLKSEEWNVKYIPSEGYDDLCLSRKHKILMNDYIKKNYDICVYLDGASGIRGSVWDFLETQCDLEHYDMTVFNHSKRKCVYEEAAAIVKFRKESQEKVRETIQYLEAQGFPRNYGLVEATILVRRTNSKDVEKAMELWFELFMRYAKRDQLVFDFALFQTQLKVKRLDYNVFDNSWFFWEKHSPKIGFDKIRVFFGDYHSIWDDNVRDVENAVLEGFEYHIDLPNDCEYIEVHLGQLENGYLSKVFINQVEMIFESNAVFCIDNKYLLGEDPLLLKINRKFIQGENIILKLEMGTLSFLDYLDCLKLYEGEMLGRDRIIDERDGMLKERDRIIKEQRKSYKRLVDILNSRKRLLKRIIKMTLMMMCDFEMDYSILLQRKEKLLWRI